MKIWQQALSQPLKIISYVLCLLFTYPSHAEPSPPDERRWLSEYPRMEFRPTPNSFTNFQIPEKPPETTPSPEETGARWNWKSPHSPEWVTLELHGLNGFVASNSKSIPDLNAKLPSLTEEHGNSEVIDTLSTSTALLLIMGILLWNRLLLRQVNSKVQDLKNDLSERKHRENKLQRIANTDDLTGVMSRRRLIREASKELRRSQRNNLAMTTALVDIDHFKQINDSLGHAMGDRILKTLTETCRNSLRKQDLIGRLGGDEFVIILKETEEKSATIVLNRLSTAIRNLRIQTPQGEAPQITVSIGITGSIQTAHSFNKILERCDQAMYAAKQNGRNQVVNFSN